MRKIWLFAVLSLLWLNSAALSQEKKMQVYSTWDAMEMDRLASLWLIKRFIDPGAGFRFYPQGTMDMEGTQIDTPTSQFRRTQQLTAYESLLKAHALSDPALLQIGEIVRDVELNIWGVKKVPESPGVNLVLKGLFLGYQDPREALDKGSVVLDALYQALGARK